MGVQDDWHAGAGPVDDRHVVQGRGLGRDAVEGLPGVVEALRGVQGQGQLDWGWLGAFWGACCAACWRLGAAGGWGEGFGAPSGTWERG